MQNTWTSPLHACIPASLKLELCGPNCILQPVIHWHKQLVQIHGRKAAYNLATSQEPLWKSWSINNEMHCTNLHHTTDLRGPSAETALDPKADYPTRALSCMQIMNQAQLYPHQSYRVSNVTKSPALRILRGVIGAMGSSDHSRNNRTPNPVGYTLSCS